MNVIDKLRCPTNYNCNNCKNYSEVDLPSYTKYFCKIGHEQTYSLITRKKGIKNIIKKIKYIDGIMYFELVCGDYESN